MEQYVPCPVCESSWAQHAGPGDRAEDVQYFDMEDCVLTAIERDFIACPQHPDVPVPLQELVPELFMTDFPARYAHHCSSVPRGGHPRCRQLPQPPLPPRLRGLLGPRPRLSEGNQAVRFPGEAAPAQLGGALGGRSPSRTPLGSSFRWPGPPPSHSYSAPCSRNRSPVLLGLREKGCPQTCCLISCLGKCHFLTMAHRTGIPETCRV